MIQKCKVTITEFGSTHNEPHQKYLKMPFSNIISTNISSNIAHRGIFCLIYTPDKKNLNQQIYLVCVENIDIGIAINT